MWEVEKFFSWENRKSGRCWFRQRATWKRYQGIWILRVATHLSPILHLSDPYKETSKNPNYKNSQFNPQNVVLCKFQFPPAWLCDNCLHSCRIWGQMSIMGWGEGILSARRASRGSQHLAGGCSTSNASQSDGAPRRLVFFISMYRQESSVYRNKLLYLYIYLGSFLLRDLPCCLQLFYLKEEKSKLNGANGMKIIWLALISEWNLYSGEASA